MSDTDAITYGVATAGSQAQHVAARVAEAKARGVTDVQTLQRIAADAVDYWQSRLARDPATNLPL